VVAPQAQVLQPKVSQGALALTVLIILLPVAAAQEETVQMLPVALADPAVEVWPHLLQVHL
jgi:hypothetical protein